MRKRVQGFTLIEILVVLAVIALLSALLFPALSRAREGGRTKVCLSNMKQLGLAFQQYVQDNGRRYPGAGEYQKWGGLKTPIVPGFKLPDGVSSGHWVKGTDDDNTAHSGPGKLAYLDDFKPTGNTADVEGGAIFPYAKSAQIYICPSNPDGRDKRLSYSMNCAIAGMHDVRMSQPSEIIVLVDEDKNNDGFWYAVSGSNSTDALTRVHNNGGNLLFADGHAKFYSYDVYPLDSSHGALKVDMTHVPRFYDQSFGAAGYWQGSEATLGSCGAP
jgi:prepilin-type N-terminal cleavage/methylation domain-containing protein/prepilin-type processing-associated H-X9-DG protein